MASIEFVGKSEPVSSKPDRVLLVAHNAAALETVGSQLESALVSTALPTLKKACESVKPGKETGASTEVFVAEGDFWQRVILCLLPTKQASRHAAPGHPHTISSMVGSKKGSGGNLAIFLLLANPERETYSACCALSRAFPLYSHKSGDKGEEASMKVTVYTGTEEVMLSSPDQQPLVKVQEMNKISLAIRQAARLVDMPTNELNVTEYVEFVKSWVENLPGVSITVIRGEELAERGLGGIYGVGKASEHPPALVILSHNAGSTEQESLCVIGKGIVYDTGGLSIKTKTTMPGMKRDMGGSAGVLGAFWSVVSNGGLANNKPFHALLCLAENSVSSKATRPDDIHTFYSGKTVEINNTDAEGRLVMADGLAYAVKHLNPGFLVNMATLTGAQSSATGHKHAAVFTNSEDFEKLIVACGQASGDLTHPLPYAPEFFRPEFKSAVADMKNSQKDRSNAGCAAPATFLSNHIEGYLDEDKPWLHIDMASPAFVGERATGFGVALLYLAAKNIGNSKL